MVAFAADAGAFAPLSCENVGVVGVGVAPAQIRLLRPGRHGVVRVTLCDGSGPGPSAPSIRICLMCVRRGAGCDREGRGTDRPGRTTEGSRSMMVSSPVAVTAEGQMERYLVDRLLVRWERYDSVQ